METIKHNLMLSPNKPLVNKNKSSRFTNKPSSLISGEYDFQWGAMDKVSGVSTEKKSSALFI